MPRQTKCAVCGNPKTAIEFSFKRRFLFIKYLTKKTICAACSAQVLKLYDTYIDQRGKRNKRGSDAKMDAR